MPKLPVDESVLDKYLLDGKLCNEIAANVNLIRMAILKDNELTAKEFLVYKQALADFDQIQKVLKMIKGAPKEKCPYQQHIQTENGYQFYRFLDLEANAFAELDKHKHLILITKADFYWEIRVKHNGNFSKLGNAVNITGYVHQTTNGSLTEILEALNSTKHFFPQPQIHRYDLRYPIENTRTFFKLLKKLLNKTPNLILSN